MSREYKGYMIDTDDSSVLKIIKPIGKGSVHLDLRGKYTSDSEAELAINRFLSLKEIPNGKTVKSR